MRPYWLVGGGDGGVGLGDGVGDAPSTDAQDATLMGYGRSM